MIEFLTDIFQSIVAERWSVLVMSLMLLSCLSAPLQVHLATTEAGFHPANAESAPGATQSDLTCAAVWLQLRLRPGSLRGARLSLHDSVWRESMVSVEASERLLAVALAQTWVVATGQCWAGRWALSLASAL